MKTSKTGKPLCFGCRKLAVNGMHYHSTSNGIREERTGYFCQEHTPVSKTIFPVFPLAQPARIKRADWVSCRDCPNVLGDVRRIAKDGSWAIVDWGFHRKRMQTDVLVVHHTIQAGDWEITDMTRKRELEEA